MWQGTCERVVSIELEDPRVKAHLVAEGHEIVDFGVATDQDVDCPDVAEPVARAVVAGEVDRAVRAAPVTDAYSAEAPSSRTTPKCFVWATWSLARTWRLLVDHRVKGELAGGISGRKEAKIDVLDEREASASVARPK
jgi:hypothetical protein